MGTRHQEQAGPAAGGTGLPRCGTHVVPKLSIAASTSFAGDLVWQMESFWDPDTLGGAAVSLVSRGHRWGALGDLPSRPGGHWRIPG